MALARTRIDIVRDTDTVDTFGDIIATPVTLYTDVPASFVERVVSDRRIDEAGAYQLLRATVRFSSRYGVAPGDIIVRTIDGMRYLVRSAIQTSQVGLWMKAIVERDGT